MNKKMFVMCGAPGSGKSTWLEEKVIKNIYAKPATVVSRDKIRFALVEEDEQYFSKENEVWKEFITQIKEDLEMWSVEEVYVDATHLNIASRSKLLRALGDSLRGVEVNAIWFDLPVETCLERNENRKGTRAYVPRSAIRRMHSSMTEPQLEEGFNKVYIITKEGIRIHE